MLREFDLYLCDASKVSGNLYRSSKASKSVEAPVCIRTTSEGLACKTGSSYY